MNTKIIVSKLVSTFKGVVLIFLITATSTAYAEYYVVYGAPVPVTVVCDACSHRVIYRKPYHRVKHYRIRHHRIHHYVSKRSCYSMSKYRLWRLGPAYCNEAVVSCRPMWRENHCYRSYREPCYGYDEENCGTTLDRATADDVYPELDIDN